MTAGYNDSPIPKSNEMRLLLKGCFSQRMIMAIDSS